MDWVLKKNTGFESLLKIRSIINDECETKEYVNNTLTPGQIVSFKYVPITSCNVESSFNQYKFILRSNRRS